MTYKEFKKQVIKEVKKLPIKVTTLDEDGCVLVEDLIDNTLKAAWKVLKPKTK